MRFFNRSQAEATIKITPFPVTRNVFSPDIATLQLKEAHLYFAYHTTNNAAPGFVEMGTTEDNFQLWKKNSGALTYPIATPTIPEFKRTPTLPIRGRVYLLPTDHLIALDEKTQNGVQFIRKRIQINVPLVVQTKERDLFSYQHRATSIKGETAIVPEGAFVKAWTHIGVPEYWGNLFDGGYNYSQVRHYDPENRLPLTRPHRLSFGKPYYMFTKLELNGE